MTSGTDAERIAELEADNRRLRRLLNQRDAPGELRHRLRGTLALLRAIIHRSARPEGTVAVFIAHLEDRLDAVARAQALADQHGEVDLRALLADELLRYGASEGERLSLTGEGVRLQPRAGQLLALAIHELAVNAVEHGVLGAGTGQIEVSWSVAKTEPDTPLVFTWDETGRPSELRSDHRGFGTEVLTRMLPYELKAETTLTVDPAGLHCTIRFPMPEQVGRVDARSPDMTSS